MFSLRSIDKKRRALINSNFVNFGIMDREFPDARKAMEYGKLVLFLYIFAVKSIIGYALSHVD